MPVTQLPFATHQPPFGVGDPSRPMHVFLGDRPPLFYLARDEFAHLLRRHRLALDRIIVEPLLDVGHFQNLSNRMVELGDDLVRDRKSTRLNSSHPSISYAVFCLKKKKTHK